MLGRYGWYFSGLWSGWILEPKAKLNLQRGVCDPQQVIPVIEKGVETEEETGPDSILFSQATILRPSQSVSTVNDNS